ncbi:MAG: hypothetical protein COB84_01440 [Rhodobacteraceae bacterium]|nr:MAG: hypothetical protein COB84_01440 [Paracoccaceae bacterium]
MKHLLLTTALLLAQPVYAQKYFDEQCLTAADKLADLMLAEHYKEAEKIVQFVEEGKFGDNFDTAVEIILIMRDRTLKINKALLDFTLVICTRER